MQDAAPVCVFDRFCDDLNIARRALSRQWTASDNLGQAPALHEIHREVMLALVNPHFVDRDDVRVLQARHGRRLRPEALHLVGVRRRAEREQLDRHDAVQADLSRLVHHPHPAPTDLFEQFVVAEGLPSCGGGW